MKTGRRVSGHSRLVLPRQGPHEEPSRGQVRGEQGQGEGTGGKL